MAFDFSAAASRASRRTGAAPPPRPDRVGVAALRIRREQELLEAGFVLPLSEWLGHNFGPSILTSDFRLEEHWRAAQKAAFTPPDADTGRRWAERAAALGLTVREYRSEMLDRGKRPDAERIAEIHAARRGHGSKYT